MASYFDDDSTVKDDEWLVGDSLDSKVSLGSFLKSVRKEKYSVINRLLSIDNDAKQVQCQVQQIKEMAPHIEWQVVANARCGLWYADSTMTSYFKSGDGHYNEWSFSLRRLNAHLLDWLHANKEQNAGLIIVDSTRTGKRFPDALARTIPIWCHTLNCFFAGSSERDSSSCPSFVTCDLVMSASEKDRIESEKIGEFVESIEDDDVIAEHLRTMAAYFVKRPLRPFWVDPLLAVSGLALTDDSVLQACTPLLLVSASNEDAFQRASKRTRTRTRTLPAVPFTYIQGSGDDCEHWCRGSTAASTLSPEHFWRHRESILELVRRQALLLDVEDRMADVELIDALCSVAKGDDAEEVREWQIDWIMDGCVGVPEAFNIRVMVCPAGRLLSLSHLQQAQREFEDGDYLIVAATHDLEHYRAELCDLDLCAVHLNGSKKYKRSLDDAMSKVAQCLDDKKESGGVCVVADGQRDAALMLGLMLVLHCCQAGSYSAVEWTGSEFGCESGWTKSQIRNAINRMSLLLPGFHPSRHLCKQMNRFFLS